MDPINNPDAVAANDQQRTLRAFVSFASTALGYDPSSSGGYDGNVYNMPGQYQALGPGGAVAVEGRPQSNLQGTGSTGSAPQAVPLVLLLVGALIVGHMLHG